MSTLSHVAPESILVTEAIASARPLTAAVKTQAKALKKWRKHERLRFFFSWCAGCHALGFSF